MLSRGIFAGVASAVALAALTSCYDIPTPACGFVCDADGACPAGYTCAVERICHRDGTTTDMMCRDPFGGVDVTPPKDVETSRRPSNLATNVPTYTDLSVRFNESVYGITEDTFQVQNTSSGAFVLGTVTSEDIGSNTTIATLRPLSRLATGTTYRVLLGADVITDLAGNRFAGGSWTFTTDGTPPTVVETMPADGDINVPVAQLAIHVVFSEGVTNVLPSTFRLFDVVEGSAVPADLMFLDGGTEATLSPQVQLEPFATYRIDLGPGILDTSDNASGQFSATFQTGMDAAPPLVSLLEPNPTFAVPLTSQFRVRFDEPVTGVDASTFTLETFDGTPILTTVSYNAATRIATLVPSYQLPASALLELHVSPSIADLSGNTTTFVAEISTGVDDVAPFVSTGTPPNNATNVPVTSSIIATFYEPVQHVDATSFLVTAPAPIEGAITSSNSGRTWTFTPSAPLPANTIVQWTLTSAITDLATPPNLLVAVTSTFSTEP